MTIKIVLKHFTVQLYLVSFCNKYQLWIVHCLLEDPFHNKNNLLQISKIHKHCRRIKEDDMHSTLEQIFSLQFHEQQVRQNENKEFV